jgi:hypothetical protein
LQDPDEADKWESELNERKKQEEQDNTESASIDAVNEDPVAVKPDMQGFDAASSGLGEATATSHNSASMSDQVVAKAEELVNNEPESLENRSSGPQLGSFEVAGASGVPAESTSADYHTRLASMPWQPTQFAWQATQFPAVAATPAPRSATALPTPIDFKPPQGPTNGSGTHDQLPEVQPASASKIPAKRHIREENSENWDKDWENFDYTRLPYGEFLHLTAAVVGVY